jgi:hypothetical protein
MLSKGMRPALPPVQNPQNFYDFPAHSVSCDVGRLADDQLPRPCPPARSSKFGELQQAGDGSKDALDLPVSCRRIIACDVCPRRCQIAHGWFSPDYSHFGMGSSSGFPHD